MKKKIQIQAISSDQFPTEIFKKLGIEIDNKKSSTSRRPTAYDRDQHQLICKALRVSDDPTAPGDTAYEAVCELKFRIERALAAKTIEETKKILAETKPLGFTPCYGF